MTSSIRYFDVVGSTRPESRLTTIRRQAERQALAVRPDQRPRFLERARA